jgi:hypothetical protein
MFESEFKRAGTKLEVVEEESLETLNVDVRATGILN